jgi:hypothetical protein
MDVEIDSVIVYNNGGHKVLCRYAGNKLTDVGTRCMVIIIRWAERPQFEGAGFLLMPNDSVMLPTEMEVIALASR